MKNKILLNTLAVAMVAVCFAGCSNAPVEESDTGIKSSDIESSISAESSVTEAESSVVTEVQAEKDVLDAAKAYGMTQVGAHQEMINLWFNLGIRVCFGRMTSRNNIIPTTIRTHFNAYSFNMFIL